MKKTMLILSVSFVVLTMAVFFIYPYLKYRASPRFQGVYIRHAEHEFGEEWDTLSIRKQEASNDRYQITRRWKYERALDGRLLSPEYKKQVTNALFLTKEGLLVDEESGLRYRNNDSNNELLAGTTIYKKVK